MMEDPEARGEGLDEERVVGAAQARGVRLYDFSVVRGYDDFV